MQHHDTAQTIAEVATKAQYGGAGAAVIFGLSASELAAIGGLIVALLGMLISNLIKWHWERKRFKLEALKYAKEGIVEDDE
jgi:ABC-type proline/glycine betaine transport system permease subunit